MSDHNYQQNSEYINSNYNPFFQQFDYNNQGQPVYYNYNTPYYPQADAASASRSDNMMLASVPEPRVADVTNSRLTPTAQEFTPRNRPQNNFSSTGAVKKKPNNDGKHWDNRRNPRQSSGGFRRDNYRNSASGWSDSRQKHRNDVMPDLSLKSTGIDLKNRPISNHPDASIARSNSAVNHSPIRDCYTEANHESDKEKNSRKQNKNRNRQNGQYNSSRNPPQSRNKDRMYGSDNRSNAPELDDNRYDDRNLPKSQSFRSNYRNSYNENKYGYYNKNNRYDRSDRNNRYYERNGGNRGSNSENWRSSKEESNTKRKQNLTAERKKKMDAASQRERLVEMIEARILECLVCCEKVKNNDKVWSCKLCFHILHFSCTIAWAQSSKIENGWRCPACQNVCSDVPKHYKCYCGKVTEPRSEPGLIAHSCGDVCMKQGRVCDHKCTILCHPGPCPDCSVMVEKYCGCGATKQSVKCSSDVEIVCEGICNKQLECTLHICKSKCHVGLCEPCDQTIQQECYCGNVGRRVPCTSEHRGSTQYECGEVCEKTLSCGNHKCSKLCHDGPCDICPKDVSLITTCPCGKKQLEAERKSCLDPVPTCNMTCGKPLKCGQPSMPHSCKEFCHEGECPPCPSTTLVRCRCGHMDKELPCKTLTSKADDARCEKKCTKKRLCGKHRCNQRCCIEIEHFCPLPCNHQLSCGLHKCDRTCHSGRCPPCVEASFEELYCECGAAVLYPPIPCGTKPPACSRPCTRPRPCGHDANHHCHTGDCPPCPVLCKRWCYGKHEERGAIPCHQVEFSCGLPCGKPLACGRHRCIKPCHLGACLLPCKQPCTVERHLCGHPCNAPCHNPPCPETVCKQIVPVTCQCGLQKSTKPCTELTEEFRAIEMAQLKDKMTDRDQPIDISDIFNRPKRPAILKVLECNDECKVTERNRRLAIGLQIRNPDLSQKLTPRYTDFMRSWAKKDPHFCQRIHNKLTELVQLAKQSKQKSRAYSFESMNRDKRHFVHEYCEHFGCESAAYDLEPNRNVVATAIKEKSWLPSMSLLEVIQRENGHRKVPGPIMTKGAPTRSESVSLKLPSRVHRPATPPGEYVDYFDDPNV